MIQPPVSTATGETGWAGPGATRPCIAGQMPYGVRGYVPLSSRGAAAAILTMEKAARAADDVIRRPVHRTQEVRST
ncbi:hypothetical protein Slala04_66090 [Streptomyces lavendulae subsp. lavendulae]|uniref:Uncharacterized protein n=1 Tax=Streptomyces antibioticus TaxID=1890 RepID=A0ABX3LQA3_STRAT|nr:hypothetical protein ADK49_12750 [Streptomyces sp. WM6349]KOV50564.1 hypothetical protein ADK98_08775 [Streptomyces sp. H036]OOQ54008.1 hypothetical protein AFM16_05250 [Streptomyces antibioticus]GLV95156.1 hypothetical protein Slala04_66090 [Streptomyces lavendulae subsp. lavendulae]